MKISRYGYYEDDIQYYTQSVIRSSVIEPFDCIQFTFIFNHFEMTKDFLRELYYKLNEQDRKDFEKDLISAATIVRVLNNQYLHNAILLIENKMIEFYQERLTNLKAIKKFKYRLDFQLHPEKYESIDYYIDGCQIISFRDGNNKMINQIIL